MRPNSLRMRLRPVNDLVIDFPCLERVGPTARVTQYPSTNGRPADPQRWGAAGQSQWAEPSYFNSTFAPASSSFFFSSAASALLTLSFTVLGAPSTRSLASLRPRPVIARTSLITLIFLSPADASTTENSVFSAAASAAGAAAPPAAAATATGAAADTPHFSSRSFESSAASRTVRLDSSSTNFARSAILAPLG